MHVCVRVCLNIVHVSVMCACLFACVCVWINEICLCECSWISCVYEHRLLYTFPTVNVLAREKQKFPGHLGISEIECEDIFICTWNCLIDRYLPVCLLHRQLVPIEPLLDLLVHHVFPAEYTF